MEEGRRQGGESEGAKSMRSHCLQQHKVKLKENKMDEKHELKKKGNMKGSRKTVKGKGRKYEKG